MATTPIILSTWHFGVPANVVGWKILSDGGSALDAVEAAARHAEADPAVTSVGLGGLPDASGRVTLDAAIMDGRGRAGAVGAIGSTTHAVSLARAVMDHTAHVMLVGGDAEQFGRVHGFPDDVLLTESAREKYNEWVAGHPVGKEMPNEEPWHHTIDSDMHDTIGVVALDRTGELAAACTTSGLAWKRPGRVGDSPMIGAGLFVDGAIGAAVATGTGELVMKTCGSFLVVEMMRQGKEPRAACEEAVARLWALNPVAEMQVGFIALRSDGLFASACLREGFEMAVTSANSRGLVTSLPHVRSAL